MASVSDAACAGSQSRKSVKDKWKLKGTTWRREENEGE